MTLEYGDHCFDGYVSSSGSCGSYEPSIASSAQSSQSSVFSDTLSAQSSIATSLSDDFRSSQEDAREQDRIYAQAQLRAQAQNNCLQQEEPSVLGKYLNASGACATYADVTSVPAQQRQHPRRCSLSRNQKPPPLVRQRDRKINFVDNLVDSATQMVEVIWPLSVVPCKSEGSSRGVLPLRTYIEETLRRSRTSYSTLQVALYYLILIRPFVPKSDFTKEQNIDCPAERALMCGRRMFLAALILASKYLQDRNYSAKAWSKMSGLRVCEINTNERTFLNKINWKLHIAKPTFEKWQEVVLRFTPNPPSSPTEGVPCTSAWKRLVPLLTPSLDTVPMEDCPNRPVEQNSEMFTLASPLTPTPMRSTLKPVQLDSTSQESTPTPSTVLPRFLEPNPDIQPPTPALARMGPLPTPNMTPSSVASNTPAVSACSSRRPSICSAWALAQKASLNRCAFDAYPDSRPPLSRRPSVMSVTSQGSSPESLMSDNSRSSRASSVSSISTASTYSSMAPQRACLARQATCRNAGLPPLKLVKEEKEGSVAQPIIIDDDLSSSPITADFSISEKVLTAPHRHSRASKHAPQPSHSTEKSRKRGRTSGRHRRSELQDEVRYQLEESLEDDLMDLDDDVASPSEAATYASNMLARCPEYTSTKEVQPLALQSRHDSSRVPIQRNDGRKRTCCSAMSVSPAPLYGEVA